MKDRKSLRILIVDDHTVVRQGLAMVLSLQPDFQVVGETGTGQQALELCTALQPDLVLLDLTLPDMSGADVAHQLREICPEARVLILTAVQDAERVFAAVDAGVEGYVLKEIAPKELAAAIRQVADGQVYLHPEITRLILQRAARGMEDAEPEAFQVQHPQLTTRELEVLELMATTATNREIAERLVLSEETIRSHVKNILRKLGQPTRTQAVVEALRRGLIRI